MGLRGPKKGKVYKPTIAKEKMREYLRERVAKELGPMIDGMMERIKGLWVEEKTITGTKCVYQKEPDAQAFKILTDQAMGRAPESIDVTSGGSALQFITGAEVVERLNKLK